MCQLGQIFVWYKAHYYYIINSFQCSYIIKGVVDRKGFWNRCITHIGNCVMLDCMPPWFGPEEIHFNGPETNNISGKLLTAEMR